MKDFNTLFLDSDDFMNDDKKHINNILTFNEAEDDEEENPENQEDVEGAEETDTSTETTDDSQTTEEETDNIQSDEGETEGGEGSDNAFSLDGENSEDSADDSSNTEQGGSGTSSNQGKKYLLYKNYKSIYDLVNNFIGRVIDFKELAENDEKKKNKYETIEFIEDKLLTLKENLKVILTDKITSMDYDKSKTIFIYTKSEINLLLNLFNKISGTN